MSAWLTGQIAGTRSRTRRCASSGEPGERLGVVLQLPLGHRVGPDRGLEAVATAAASML